MIPIRLENSLINFVLSSDHYSKLNLKTVSVTGNPIPRVVISTKEMYRKLRYVDRFVDL